MKTFIDIVFGYLEGFVPIRMFAETGTADQQPVIEFCGIDEAAARLERLAPLAAHRQLGLYVIPGTTTQRASAQASDVVQTGVLVVDLDKSEISENRDLLVKHIGPPTLEVASGGRTEQRKRKLHLYWRLTEAATGEDLERVRLMRQKLARRGGGDPSFGSMHQPIRVPGSIHGKYGRLTPVEILSVNDREYDLVELETAIDELPELLPVQSVGGTATCSTRLTTRGLATTRIRAGGVDGITRFGALSSFIGHWVRNVRIGHATPDEAWHAVHDYNAAQISPPWEEQRLRREFAAIMKKDAENHGSLRAGVGAKIHTVSAPDSSDDAVAAAFVANEGADWRYVPAWNKWLRWQGTHWALDETNQIREQVRQACRGATQLLRDKPGEARRIASNKTISAVVAITGADPLVARAPADWDQHPMLLNTPAGTIDLETGECLNNDRHHAITQITGASLGSTCPRWREFLVQITDGDDELQKYLQRLAGYCLTGRTDEQIFAFFHGSGANGKSVFLNAIGNALGSYAATAALGTFTVSKSDRHLTELAGLRAARLVLVSETEAGRAWDEARIKSISGGERIRANFMRQDHFEFTPQFKLLVAGNHRPTLQGVGEAMRRRMHVVPFDVTIPPEHRDKRLPDTLRDEAGGILAWMVEGCASWQVDGLKPPARVLAASERYFEAEDVVGQWIEDCCAKAPAASATSRQLFDNWSAWANASGHPPGSTKSFGEALRAHGFDDAKVNGVRGWKGIKIGPHAHRVGDAG
ncbi:hypothetical protein KB874_20440 [Aestuariicoccus sp. KMU-90]|uniref:SF3 helicase domain-containing protein n=2 Tax=Thetidibacter halocola TaxID=2827239 RepID=A0A8J7WJH7_9RHOB|nr:hypothetical protein [Thetidibacter halocola]